MASRLPPGEAERRRKERARATWSGEKYKKVEPGSFTDWAAAAAAFINGDIEFALEDAVATGRPFVKRPHANPNLAALDLDEIPNSLADLNKGYRRVVMAAFRAADSKDTSPEYVNAFSRLTRAFETIKRQRGW